jgi:hypothetical protein
VWAGCGEKNKHNRGTIRDPQRRPGTNKRLIDSLTHSSLTDKIEKREASPTDS